MTTISAKKPETSSTTSFEDTSVAFSSKSNFELRKTYFIFAAMNNNFLVDFGKSFLKFTLKIRFPFIKSIVKSTVFGHFCGGENITDCEKTINNLGKYDIGAILDYSVEGEKTEAGFDATLAETLLTIEKAAKSTHVPFSVFKVTGIAPFHILEKVQSKQTLSPEEEKQWKRVQERMAAICKRAYELNVKTLVDGEETWIQDTIDNLAYAMMEKYNKEKPIIYNTYQLYRADMLGNLKVAFEVATQKNYFLGAKLVRGAYMERESKRAKEMNYPDPIQPGKEACDKDFDEAILFCMNNIEHFGLVCGTHNEQSNKYLIELMLAKNISPADERVYFAQLFGMSDQISYALAKDHYKVAKYLPYGPVEAVMPYLFRRADENTSVKGQTSREFLLIKKEIDRRKK